MSVCQSDREEIEEQRVHLCGQRRKYILRSFSYENSPGFTNFGAEVLGVLRLDGSVEDVHIAGCAYRALAKSATLQQARGLIEH
jgi:hypothetical protein